MSSWLLNYRSWAVTAVVWVVLWVWLPMPNSTFDVGEFVAWAMLWISWLSR